MKVFLVTLVLAVACLNVRADSIDEKKKQCIASSGVKPEEIAEVNNGNYENPSQELKKYVLCLYELGIVGDTLESLSLDPAMHTLPSYVDKAKAKSILQGCINQKLEGTPEHISYEIFKCLYTNDQIKTLIPLCCKKP